MSIICHAVALARATLCVSALTVLSACGGGGPSWAVETQETFVLSQSEINCTQEAGGDCAELELTGLPVSKTPDEAPVWREVPRTAGASVIARIAPERQADGKWRFTVIFKGGLLPGDYSGTVEITLSSFLTQYVPARLGYKVTVSSLKGQQTALKPLVGASDWEGVAGNAAHTGAVAASLDVGKFTPRWTQTYSSSMTLDGLAAANGQVYLRQSETVTADGKTTYRSALLALSEHDGTQQWRYEGVDESVLSAPGVQGRLLVSVDNLDKLLSFDAVTGQKQHESALPNNGIAAFRSGLAPTLWAGNAYIGRANDVVAADAPSTRTRWSTSLGASAPKLDVRWVPAVNDDMVFAFGDAQLSVYRSADGIKLFDVAIFGPQDSGVDTSLSESPVIVDAKQVLLLDRPGSDVYRIDNSLSLVDLDTRTVRWTLKGRFTTPAVVGGGMVYIGNMASLQMEARRVSDGSLAWSWPLSSVQERRFGRDLILTNNLLFVSGDRKTYAIDLNTHQAVWNFPMAGELALSPNGVLYILNRYTQTRWLTGINLQ
jgi:outer membrane protein assembly factor BamB